MLLKPGSFFPASLALSSRPSFCVKELSNCLKKEAKIIEILSGFKNFFFWGGGYELKNFKHFLDASLYYFV